MKNKNSQEISLSRKIALIFIAVFVIEIFLFVICISLSLNSLKKDSTKLTISSCLSTAESIANKYGIDSLNEFHYDDISLFIINTDGTYQVQGSTDLIENQSEFVKNIYEVTEESGDGSIDINFGEVFYSYLKLTSGEIIVAVSNGDYLNDASLKTIGYLVVVYLVVFLTGDVIVLFWMKSIVNRLNRLCNFVEVMPDNKYRNIYIDDGDDEIETLSYKIDDMRRRIVKDEINREAMLQNISHDLKTPIAVIRSYAEAIGDKIEDISKTEIIVEQAKKLEKKVKNLIELNKLEYLFTTGKLDDVKIAPIIEKIVNNCKHLASQLEFKLDLDETIFVGKQDNYYTAFENIIENATRYAKAQVSVTLKEGVLTIHNDGVPIDNNFVVNGFKPYAKGSSGKFGLGMSISSKTLELFNMDLKVANVEDGVEFTIKAK